MFEFLRKISRPGIGFLLFGIFFLYMSAGDFVTSLKSPKDFEDVLNGEISAGDRVEGRVPYLLDAFASEQTWTENRSNNSVTPKKTSHYYYVLPFGDGYMGLTVSKDDASEAKDLTDQTYGYLAGGSYPSANLVVDTRIAKMDGELAEMFREELEEYYGFTSREIDQMELLMAEPRSFTAVRVFFIIGTVSSLLGIALLVRRFRMFA